LRKVSRSGTQNSQSKSLREQILPVLHALNEPEKRNVGKTKADRKRLQRKTRLKERRRRIVRSSQMERAEYFFWEAMETEEQGNHGKALERLEKAVQIQPKNEEYLFELGRLGHELGRSDVELKALLSLQKMEALDLEGTFSLCALLTSMHRYGEALDHIRECLRMIPHRRVRNKKTILKSLERQRLYCETMLQTEEVRTAKPLPAREMPVPEKARKEVVSETLVKKSPPLEIQVRMEVDTLPLERAVTEERLSSQEDYELALEAYRIRFSESFENLICLGNLQGVRSFWYQEETVKKVMKTFRGRALLADEVGLGKTIEALMILKEYVMRGLIKTALILVPSPLVTQWGEELAAKFRLTFRSTEDSDFNSGEKSFWNHGNVLASINVAKSRNNFPLVTRREWDLVIVDEAHHLKNRNTLNWKLVNSLKKRFLLLLTATPVENNLMELHNLITLLKPGQLKTASEFRREFMTSGDPTDPRNRESLKELLGEIMIRNTRALAKLEIPPRFAQTVKVKSFDTEKRLYEKVSSLTRAISKADGAGRRLLLKNLLEEAGSSPRAMGLSLSRLLEKRDSLSRYEGEIRDAYEMCRSLEENSKHRILLTLIKASEEKTIVFVKYLGTLEQIAEFLDRQQIPCALFHGRMDSRAKEEQIRRFRDEVGILVTTEIGGEGRNLQFCRQMINYDLPWNPMRIEQRIGRIHRIGQQREVLIYNLCAEGSIEERILDILDKKINMFEMVIGEIDMILGRIAGEQDFSEMVYDIWVNSPNEEKVEKGFSQLAARLKRAKTGYESTRALDEKLFGENYEL
jgi:SNF2 family DNA or RNA helicase